MSDKLFGKKHAAEETAREQGLLASGANHAAGTFATRVARAALPPPSRPWPTRRPSRKR